MADLPLRVERRYGVSKERFLLRPWYLLAAPLAHLWLALSELMVLLSAIESGLLG